MVNGFNAAILFMMIAGVGGLGNGVVNYGGFAMPGIVQKVIPTADGKPDVPVQMLMLGVFGNVILGAISGAIVFMWIQKDVWIFQDMVQPPTGLQGLFALLAGLSGSVFLDTILDWFQKRYLGKTTEAAMATTPSTTTTVTTVPDPGLDEIMQQFKRAPRASVALAKFK